METFQVLLDLTLPYMLCFEKSLELNHLAMLPLFITANRIIPLVAGGSFLKVFGKNRLGEVVKEAFSSGVETTLLCEQVTIGVTSFGELLNQRRSQKRPKQKRDLYSTECIRESQKQTNLGAKRLEGTSWKANTPRPPPTEAGTFSTLESVR